MVLSPIDIHNKEFTRGFRGYQEDEVNGFLDQVMKDYEITIRKNKSYEKEIKDLHERLKNYQAMEGTLNKSIVVAQETGEDIKANARKEAELIIKEAEKNADRIINESLERSRKIQLEMEEMERQAKVFRTRLKMLIEAQLDMVNNDDWNAFLKQGEQMVTETNTLAE